MTDESKTQQPKMENLELNKETLQDLSEAEIERVKGGAVGPLPYKTSSTPLCGCTNIS